FYHSVALSIIHSICTSIYHSIVLKMSNHHWIVFPPQRNPPLVVSDLFEDVKDGVMLLALLEVLSGHKLPCEQGRKLRRIHWVANVGRALKFLEGRRSAYRGSPIKLVNINTTDVVDGRPSIVLGLIWTIILYFQIEELTSHLPALQPQSSSNSSVESSNSAETSSPPVKRKPRLSFQGGAKRALLKWVQTTATKRLGLDVKDFGPSWRTGVAFHAVIFALQPHLVNMERVWRRPNRDNLEEAFSVAEKELGIPRLLDPEDVDVDKPDEKSIMTYVAQFLKHHPDRQETEIRREQRKTLRELKAWADQLERDCAQAQRDGGSLAVQYQTFKRYRVQFEVQRRQVETCIQSTQKDSKLTEDQALVKQAWERLSARFLDWHLQLDSGLPHPLGEVGVWLHQAEKILREELVPQQAHDETAKAIHKKRLHDQVNQGNLHKQTLQLIHRDRCVNNVPIPMEQLQDMAERLNYISTSSHVHLSKLEFWETKYSMLAFLTLVESKLKSWIIKYGRLESMELLLQSYGSFVEGQQFFEKYESSHQALINTAELYIKADSSVEGGVKLFLREVSDQWRSLSVEVRSVRSMLEEVQCNWLRYNSCVASLQAWLEDAQGALRQPENTKREFFRNLPHWMEQHAAMNDAGNFLIETCDETVTRDIKHQLLLLNGRWRELFLKVKKVNKLVHILKIGNCSVHLSSPKLPGVDAQYKAAARSAQLLAKDSVHGSGSKALSSVTTAEAQLHQVCTILCYHFHLKSSSALMQEALEWRQVAETNGNLMRRYEESRADLEKVLRVGQACLKERGEPDELFLKHNEFFGRLDQHILSAYLKACDDLTDIISEEDQQSLRETVRRLHKQWKDIQAEAPSHLLRLRVETERRLVMAMLQECQVELKREDKALLTAGSERMIKEHRAFFRQKNPLSACEKRLKTMEHLCQDLPENDMGHQTLEETRDHLSEVRGLVERTHLKLQQHSDKWREWHASLSDLKMMHRWWQGFSRESEAFFSWVCDSKKELEAFSRTSANLDEQIHTVEMLKEGLEEKMDVFSRLEAEFHTLIHFVTPNEAGRIKTRLMQIGRYREEFKNSVEQREAELHSSLKNTKQFIQDLNEVILHTVHGSIYSSYLIYYLNHSRCVLLNVSMHFRWKKAVADLQQAHKLHTQQATEKQSKLENQLTLWQRYERDLSHLQSWLNRCESLCSSDSPYLTTDNVKLHSQLQMLQVKVSLQNQGRSLEALQPHLDALSPSLASKDLQHLQTRKEDCLQLFSEAQSLVEHRDEALLKLKDFCETYNKARISLQTFQDAVEGRGSWDDSKVRDINQELGDIAKELACLEVQAISLDIILNKAHFHLQGAEEERTSCRGLVDDVALSVQVLQRSIGTKQSEAEALATMWSSFRGWKELLLGSLAKLEDRANIPWPTEASAHAFQQRYMHLCVFSAITDFRIETEVSCSCSFEVMAADLRKQISHAAEVYEQTRGMYKDFNSQRQQLQDLISQISEQLKTSEDSLSEFSSSSDPENFVKIKVSEVELYLNTVVYLFLLRYETRVVELSNWLQQLEVRLKTDAPLWGESQSAAPDCSEELRRVEEIHRELLMRRYIWTVCVHVCEENVPDIRDYFCVCLYLHLLVYPSRIHLSCLYLLFHRASLERLCQSSLTITERGSRSENGVAAELLTNHKVLLQEARSRLRSLQEYQAFEEALKAVETWLEDVERKLEKLENTEGNKKEVEEKLEQAQDILLMKGEGEVKLNMAAGKAELAIKSSGEVERGVICSKLQEVEDAWAALLLRAMSCHSRLEWTVNQWDLFVESRAQLQRWLEGVGLEVKGPLEPQLGLREKRKQLERLRLLSSDVEDHQGALCYLEESAAELYKRTGDPVFKEEEMVLLRAQFEDVKERVRLSEDVVLEHKKYMETIRELTDWLMVVGEELQQCSDPSGDSPTLSRKLTEVRELLERGACEGRERLRRVRLSAERAGRHTAAAGCELMDGEVAALARALHQWEGASLRARDALETAVAAATGAEREHTRLTAQLEGEMEKLEGQLKEWSEGLSSAERRNSGAAAVEGWTVAKGVLEGLQTAEVMEEKLKAQLNELCGFSSDLSPQSDRVSALIKLHNSLSLRASRECQNKEKLLEQRFRSSLHDFRQWMVNANISTAKCFDSPHSIQDASIALQQIQEFKSDKEQGQTRLNAVLTYGEQLSSMVPADRMQAIRTKANAAKDDWKSLMDSLQRRETALQVLQSQMQDFEASVEPLQDWMNRTEISVQESSARLHDLPAKRLELSKLQTLLEEMRSRESELAELRGRAHGLWEGQGAGKSFVHQVCQLAACYLALSNLIKEKVSRVERVVGEHQLFSQGLQELQNWVSESQQVLKTCRCPTSDKSVLITRMGQLETLLAACQGREIQLKMLITRGESVQRNTSAEGVPVVRKQIQDLKDSWESLLSTSIQCKSQLEGALSHWTSYQEDVSQFECWMERVEESLGNSDKHYAEMRDKTANLGRAKLLYEEVLSHSSPLETIAAKGSNMTEHTATQQEIQKLSERYTAIKDKAKAAVSKAEELVLLHQEYQRGLHMFEDWLEQEQNSLALLSPLDEDVNALENTLKELQMLQSHCPKGHNLLSSVLASRERVIPWGAPQIEDRALETAQTEWQGYQDRLGETKVQVEQALARVQQLEGVFQSLDQWLVDIELKVKVRSHRRSDVTAKEAQLQHLKAAQRQTEVEGLSTLAQQVVEDAHVSGRISTRVTQLTARYHALLLQIQASQPCTFEEMQNITEAQNALRTFSDWLSAARKNFRIVTKRTEALDRITMEKKMKRLESLQGDMDQGHSLLKTLRESAEQAVSFLDDPGASKLEREVQTGRSQLEELILGLREEHATLERSIVLYKDFQERYKSQIQWLRETRALLCSTVEPKAELYQRKAQLNKYKAVEQMLLSRDSAVSFVLEKGETLLTLLHSPSITDNMTRLQADYQELCSSARTHVHKLEAQVKKQEAYHKDLQEIERWLLQMSSRMVTPDPSSGGGLEAATQQLARHKAIMEEIAGFEERLATLKEKGEELLSGCSERLQARLRQQIQNHQQGARDSYSAICSTAQRVYQSLDWELQKHASLRDTLQQCQTWLSNVQEEIQLPAHAPHCLQEALAQMKQERTLQEQASTYLQLVCSTCDLSDDKVRETAAEIQQVKLQIEERMLESQELAENWREIKDLRSNLECHLLEAEQLLQSMLRRPAELEPKVAQNQLDQAQDFIQEMRARQVDLTQLRESINRLTAGQESPELMEVGRLRCAWLDLGRQAAQLLEQKEEDLQRSGDYHDCICMVEELFDQLSKKWDQLARGDIESTAECLDALKKLSTDLQDQRCVLDDLRNNRHGILPRLSLEDRDLVKEQVGYLEQRWTQVESLVQQKIQDSAQTLEELSQIEDHLREAQEWAELQQPSLSEVLKTSPPPDLAQSFLFDHLSFCAELEAKQKLLAEAVTDANSLSSRLGLNERRKLQTLIQEAQTVVESLGTKAAQYRKSLSKVFTERTQFLQALDRAAEWIRKQEQRALADDHVALLPNILHKQVSSCKNFTSSLRAYQVELTSLWVQGRELVKDATDEEKKETLQKLEELQVTFEASLQKSTEHLQHLEKALVIRKYFKVDLDRICEWLKQAEVATFPIIDLSGNDEELQNQLTGYQQLLDHVSEYENLLLIVQRAGQEILPTLNEVDHCYLDEKLNGLPQQYNDMLLLIREKRDRIQQVLLERREFEYLIDATRKALKELQEKCDGLEMKSANQNVEEGERLHSSYEDLMKDLANLFQGMKDLRVKTQDFLIMGQPYAPEVIDQLVHLHGSLNQQIECKMKELRKTLKILNDHRAVIEKMDCSITRFKEQLGKFDSKGEEEADAMERLSTLHNLSKCFEEVSSYPEGLKAQNDDLIQHFDSKTLKTQVIFREEQLLTLKQKMNAHIEECERGFRGNKDFQTDIKVSIDWLKSLKDRLRYPLMFEEAKIELVQEEVRSLSALQEQMKSRFRLLEYMTDAEKQKYINDQKPFPKLFETTLMDIPKLQDDLQQAVHTKQVALQTILSLLQRYHHTLQSVQQWFEDAGALLKHAPQEVDLEKISNCLKDLKNITSQEQTVKGTMQEMQGLVPQMSDFFSPSVMMQIQSITQWRSFQDKTEEVIRQMNEVEKRMTEFKTARANSEEEAEDKLCLYQSQVQGLEDALNGLKERAAQFDQPAIKDATSRSVCSLSHRWTRLLSVARAQVKALQDSLEKMRAVCEDLHSRVPDNMVEKASSMAALQSLLEYHDSFSREVERESSALTLLRHHVLNLFLHPHASASTTDSKHNQDNPCLLEIQSIQEKYDKYEYLQQVQVELREREEVVRELGLLKGWIQDTQGLLLSPTADLDNLLTDLEVLQTTLYSMRSHRQNLEQIADLQQMKYQDLNATLPSEISTQLAEVTLALGSAEDQVPSFILGMSRMQVPSVLCLFEELEECGRALSELDVAVQEFGERSAFGETWLKAMIIFQFCLLTFHLQIGSFFLNKMHSTNWSFSLPASQMQEQIRTHQALLQEWQDLQGEFEGLVERVGLLGEVVQTDALHQQVAELSRHAEELQQRAKTRLLMLQDAAKDLGRLESDVKSLHQSIERVQETLASPDLARLSLREQLAQRQLLLSEMEGLKQQVQDMQMCQSTLRLPEDVIAALPLCVTAQSLQQESSQLQHNTIQQCNILQEAMVQYEQYEQEVKNLQRLIEEAHRVIQDRPVATGNIQELQTQIQHHEELALKIKGYQEQISALNSKCKMLTVKAKHATMLLTVSEVDGLSDGLEELEDEEEEMPKHPPAHPSVVMMTAGRCHTLLSPVTEESGEEGTNSEVSSPPACRSPSPGPNADTSQVPRASNPNLATSWRAPLSRAPLQELYDPSMESAASANLDDLQRSWETLKNVISEKQKSLYEALERQQHYQETLQSVSTKMESIETALNEGLEPSKSPESQMAAHQALMDEILMLQDEISALQACFSQELQLDEDSLEADAGDQLALQSTLTVLGERMATIHMKASGKRQLLEERLSEQLEEQRQEQALQRYHSEAEELDNWLLSTRATLSSTLQPHPQDMDMEEQLIDCQNMLLEIEQKVLCLSELSVHSESLLMEGKAGTRGDAEQLSLKLHSLKSSLLELQRILQDKQTHIQVRDTTLTSQKEQLGEQKKLLQSVHSNCTLFTCLYLCLACCLSFMKGKDEGVQHRLIMSFFLGYVGLLQNFLKGMLVSVSSPCGVFRGEQLSQDILSPRSLFEGFSQDLEVLPQTSGADIKRAHALKRALYEAVSSTSSWLDNAENELVSGPVLLSDDSETHLGHLESLNKEVKNVNEEVCKCRDVLGGTEQLWDGESGESVVVEEVLDGLEGRLKLLDTVLEQRCDTMKDKLQELTVFQAELRLLLASLSDSKYQLLQKMNAAVDRPIVAEAEDSLREFEQKVSEMRSRGETLQPNQLCTQELLKLQDAYEELVEMVGSKRSGLNQSLVLKAQYEKALQDLVDLLDTAQDKMTADQKMKVGSVIEVQILLDKHKEYFQGLETHVVLTQAFFRQVSGLVVQREVQSLEETVAQAQAVLKQAHKRGVELEGILEWWSRLVGDYQALYRQLEAVESNIPSVGLVEETEDRLSDRIALYQRLKASLSERQQQLYKLLEDGKRLLLHVSCSELETQLTQLGDHWLSTTTKINKELHRLDSILKHWIRYQCESAELSQWLSSALDRLEFWSTQSVTVPQELETVRDHLHAFLEFSKEVDAKSSLRASVQSQGNQLLRLKKVDTAALRANLAQVDTQWADLLARIPVVQEKLHQLQMEKLPSRHAITELMSWISLMENIIQEDQQKIMGAVGSDAVQMYLQKYKGFQIDLSCKQLTVDFVNQSVLQISSQDVEGKRSDKTDFAERLGAMNRRWQILQGLVTEKIQVLEGLLESWLEYENVVQTLKTWFSVQEERLKKKHRIEDVSSAQNALKDCQEMEVLVKEKEKDMEKAEEKGCLLIQDKKGEAGTVIMDTLKGLNQSWANLDHMTVSLRSVLEQWSLYKQAYEEIQGYLMEGRYTISRLRLLTGSPEAVQVQVENLESLQDELEKQESSLRKLGSITQQLLTDCHPSVSDSLNSALADVNLRWNTLLEQISDQLRRSKSLLQLWQHYKALHAQSSTDIQKLEDQVEQLLKSATHRDVTEQEVKVWIYQYMVCLCAWIMLVTQKYSVLQQLDEFSEQLRQQVDPSAMTTFHTDHLSLTQRLATVGHTLQRQQSLLEVGMRDYERFSKELHSLSHWSEEAERVLKEPDQIGSPDISSVQEHMEKLKTQMLKLSSLSPDLERLNELGYQLPLNDNEIKRLQNLNRSWSSNSARTIERFSKLQALVLQRQTFLEKCDAWMTFLTQTEEKLATEISGNYQSLLDQQREHELFQAEMFSRQQILYSIINDGHQLLNQGQVEDRDEFGLKLALLSNQWQGVVRRAQQRRGIIDSLVRQWQRYTELIEKLRHWLQEVSMEPEEQQQVSTVALQQIRGMLDHIQLKERVLQRQQGSYILTVEAGRQLLLWADTRTEASLHTELTDVQERWRTINIRLDERKKELLSLLRDWDQCEKGIAASHEKLRDFKQKLSAPLPDHHEELHTEQIRCKELESSIEGWADDVAGLCILRESLSSGLSADNLTVLQERLILLQRQWEETCHQLSLRRQQVSERLNEWAVFNEKNKELCEWLTQMESKVSQNGDISIGEMIEKLRKDYQEEISVAKENKHQLEQMGERLAQASHESKAAEIQYKLSKVNERWQHLLDLIEARVKKLRETLVAVQQLDKNMSSLRSWLAHIETELSRPIVYETCDSHEIQRKLKQQQDLQHDIEKHSTGVASVLNLCEVLLHDCDACATETECESIQQATRGLDRRWRNICAIAMERRLKIEETWRLWQKFLDDYSRFEEWLKVSERTAALPNSSGVLYTIAKEELKKFEAFQRQVQEFLTQLELINKQYRRLARENRTDSSCHLRQMVHDGNRRWDVLQRRVAAILRRLKHFIGQREEFETARDGVLVWLTEMDLQLTNIEHFSECDVQAKIKQLKAFQQEISLNMGKMESVFGQGEVLMEKSEPLDAAVIEEELDELQRYCREVFGRVERYYQKLTRLPLTDDEGEGSDREFESGDLSDLQWGEDGTMSQTSSRPPSAGTAPVRTNDSGRDTPASEDSIPLEWDHDYDLDPMGHTMSAQRGRQKDEDEELLCLATAALTGEYVVIPESPEAYIKLTENTLRSSSGSLHAQFRLLDNMMDTSCYSLQETDGTMGGHDTSYMGYMRLMDDCRGSLKAVRRVEGELEEEEDKLSGLSNPDNTETQSTGVIERWELIQAQSADSDHKEREDLVLLQKMTSDLDAMEAWLSQAEAELEELRGKNLSADIHTIEQRIRKLKELQKAMDSHKSKVLSINLNSVTLLQSDSEESQDLKTKLKEMNSRWDRLGKSLKDWRTALQDALMQCQEFHELSHGLLLWLENIDRRRNEIIPIASGLDRHTLQAHYRALKQIQRELLESEQKVDSLQELSGQLLVQAHGSECLEAQERVHVIGNRLRLLLKAVAADLELSSPNSQDASLWSVTDDADTSGSLSPVSGVSISTKRQSLRGKCSVLPSGSGCVSSRSGSSGSQGGAAVARCQPFLLRVLRAALPLQLLLLLIVGLTCLVPMTEQDYSCAHANNFARSFHPMLHYTNGPPPV
uniref:Spectrin repeat containing, nuclear envelope 1a n=1 Tax=Cyprinus carpio TaxID=7962 RepID=A0A8C1K642_CYPCA